MKAVTVQQMRSLESAAVAKGISLDQLMENAGRAVADAVCRFLQSPYGKRIVVLIGPGNNGGDGFVAARHLAMRGANTKCVLLTGRPDNDPKRALAEAAGARTIHAANREYDGVLATADLVLDAVLGTGRARRISPELGLLLDAARVVAAPIHAVDLPTGLNADTGTFDPLGLPADVTYMLGLPKLGPLVRAGDGHLGRIESLDIGIPPGLDEHVNAELIDVDLAAGLLPPRAANANKGTFGRALIFAGSPNYLGAAALATTAALRSGAGLVALAARRSVYSLVAGRISDAIYHPLPEEPHGNIDPLNAASSLLEASRSASSMLIGPGLGRELATDSLVRTFITSDRGAQATVLDADCLNILAGTPRWWENIAGPKVLTPHPGEMGRFLGSSARDVESDRVAAVREAAVRFDSTVVLKGAATLIARPDGALRISPWVNPGLAKGGTGDVLAGLLAGLLAQMPDRPFDAATLAVFVHGQAGQIARDELGAVAMTASDVAEALPQAFLSIRRV